MKKLLCNTLIIIIMLGVFCNGYFSFSGLSFYDRVSYAEADNWTSCDSSDLVTAFRYYCKSRNLAIEGSVADALTTFTTNTFNNICATLGIDPTQLQAELKKTTGGNLGLRFLFSNTGITAYNRIFAEFLQNNDLSVGDEVSDDVVYSAESYSYNGNSCIVYEIDLNPNTNSDMRYTRYDHILKFGSAYQYSYNDLINIGLDTSVASTNLNLSYSESLDIQSTLLHVKNSTSSKGLIAISAYNNPIYKTELNEIQFGTTVYGWYSVVKYANGTLRPCYFSSAYTTSGNDTGKYTLHVFGGSLDNDDLENANVTITTNNNTINNNTYNNNYVIIYNEGDTYVSDDDDEPLPTTPPGGGGGGDDPDNPLEPYDPTKPFPDTPDNPTPDPGVHGSPGSDGTITIPDFNFDLPDINWSLDGLQHKFPFSLPFDLYNACKLLNAEPQTPELDYTVDLVVYQWPIQMDLHWLDPAARVIRIFELLAFVVGLILITRHLIGG